jgi:hypothetical protein
MFKYNEFSFLFLQTPSDEGRKDIELMFKREWNINIVWVLKRRNHCSALKGMFIKRPECTGNREPFEANSRTRHI